MKKKISFICVILLLFVFSKSDIPIYAGTDVSIYAGDKSAPDIYLNLSKFLSNGLIHGYVRDLDSDLYNYSLILNGVSLGSSYINDTIKSKYAHFWLNTSLFNTTYGYHNHLTITAFNADTSPPSPYSVNQGGGAGGSGGGGFCDTASCWIPEIIPDSSKETENSFDSTDLTAPTINFSFVDFNCFIGGSFLGVKDDESGVDVKKTKVTYYYDELSVFVEAKNSDGITMDMLVTWYNGTLDKNPLGAGDPFYISGGLLFLSLIIMTGILRKRKKKKKLS